MNLFDISTEGLLRLICVMTDDIFDQTKHHNHGGPHKFRLIFSRKELATVDIEGR